MYLQKVKDLCEKNNVSIARLERESGIGNGTIAAWDDYTPKITSLQKVAAYFNVPVTYFLDEEVYDAESATRSSGSS